MYTFCYSTTTYFYAPWNHATIHHYYHSISLIYLYNRNEDLQPTLMFAKRYLHMKCYETLLKLRSLFAKRLAFDQVLVPKRLSIGSGIGNLWFGTYEIEKGGSLPPARKRRHDFCRRTRKLGD